MRVLSTLDVTGDVLEHDDRIVHDHTDGDGERTERDDIERRIGNRQVDKRHDKGDRNGDTDDECCTPSAEEEEHNEYDEDKGVHDGFFEGVDGVLNGLREVVDLLNLDVGRELFLNTLQLFLDVLTDLDGVGTGLLGDDKTYGFASVGFLVEREVLDGILDGCDIADEDLLSLRGHGDHEVGDLGGLDILGADLHLVLLSRHLNRT